MTPSSKRDPKRQFARWLSERDAGGRYRAGRYWLVTIAMVFLLAIWLFETCPKTYHENMGDSLAAHAACGRTSRTLSDRPGSVPVQDAVQG